MSYDIRMIEPKTKKDIMLDSIHGFTGGTYAVGGTKKAWLNITYNYSKYYYRHIDEAQGIRFLYGKTGKECLPILRKTIRVLGRNVIRGGYWKATKGNAGNALLGLVAFCKARPDGIFIGD